MCTCPMPVYVRYAIDVDGHVIKVYDPLIHHQSADPGGRQDPVGNARTGAGSAATGPWWWLAAS